MFLIRVSCLTRFYARARRYFKTERKPNRKRPEKCRLRRVLLGRTNWYIYFIYLPVWGLWFFFFFFLSFFHNIITVVENFISIVCHVVVVVVVVFRNRYSCVHVSWWGGFEIESVSCRGPREVRTHKITGLVCTGCPPRRSDKHVFD